MKAIFRCDAGPAIGAGHVNRCLALAHALAAEGWGCAFAAAPGSRAAVPALTAGPYPCRDIEAADEPAALRRLWPEGCDLLVVDHYGRDATFEAACRPWAGRLAVIDDLADRPHDCDILIDAAPRPAAAYDGLVPPDCRRLLGPHHAPLAPGFAPARFGELPRQAAGSVRSLLIALGATDPGNLTGAVLDSLAGFEGDIHVILGEHAPHGEDIAARLTAEGRTFATGVADMTGPLLAADLAIGAAGVSAWERCALALPSLALIAADNQRQTAAAIEAAGAARLLANAAAAGDAVAALSSDAGRRERMARAAAGLCDGLGAARFAAAVAGDACARDGRPVRLRPAGPGDGEPMFAWQQDPRTRAHAREPAPPTRAEHDAWLARTLADPTGLCEIVLHGERPAGVVRLDRRSAPRTRPVVFEVSIYTAPDSHGQGIGRAALAQLRALVPWACLRAHIQPGNTASLALFRAAGYRPAEPDWFVHQPRAMGRRAAE